MGPAAARFRAAKCSGDALGGPASFADELQRADEVADLMVQEAARLGRRFR